MNEEQHQAINDVRNSIEIRLFAMRRSGSHAFLNWLTTLYQDKTCFINDVSRREGINPEQRCDNLPSLPLVRRAALNERKELLLYNFEDVDLADWENWSIPISIKGTSRTEWTILLLRDPYNMFASRIALRRNRPKNMFALEVAPPHESGAKWACNMWLQHANEFLGHTRLLKGDRVIRVSYNSWIANDRYRRQICEKIGGKYDDKALSQTPKYGFGSSFGCNDNRGLEFPYLFRWMGFNGDDEYEQIVSRKDITALSYEIFGQIRH